jgi:hypothetical protein
MELHSSPSSQSNFISCAWFLIKFLHLYLLNVEIVCLKCEYGFHLSGFEAKCLKNVDGRIQVSSKQNSNYFGFHLFILQWNFYIIWVLLKIKYFACAMYIVWGYCVTSWKAVGLSLDEVIKFFKFTFQLHHGPEVYSASNRNKCQKILRVNGT